jgi:hypothetical protein
MAINPIVYMLLTLAWFGVGTCSRRLAKTGLMNQKT